MLFLSNGNKMNAQTEWSGALTTFSKSDNTDWTLATNQDQITSNVSITRANNRGLFNIVLESEAGQNGNGPAPSDTEWAFGNINDGVGTLTFTTWGVAHTAASGVGVGSPPSLIGQDMVVHLITDDIYIDIKLLSWSVGGNGASSGGGFSYERSTDQSLSTNEFELNKKIKLFPNPSSEFLQISNLKSKESYSIYNVLGAEIKNGSISNNEQIDIRNLTNELYFLKFLDGTTIKFLKK
jgi:hypothetical protein